MDRVVIENSSNIAEIGYHAPSMTLEVMFKHGGIYEYTGVPAEVHNEIMAAESKGGFFSKNIKGTYEFKRLDPVTIPDA